MKPDNPPKIHSKVRETLCVQDYEEPKPSRSSKTTKKDDLAKAAATPLPKEARTEQEAQEDDEEDADLHAKPAKGGKKSHKAPQPTQEDLEDIEPAEGDAEPSAHTVQFQSCMHGLMENTLMLSAVQDNLCTIACWAACLHW